MQYRSARVAVLVMLAVLAIQPMRIAAHPLDAPSTYTVQPGDTLTIIAARVGLASWQPIFAANRDRISNPNLLQIGQVLVIPGAQTTPGVPKQGVPKQGAPQPYALPLPRAATPRSEYDDPHAGYPAIDLQVGTGTPVYAIKGGSVSYVGGQCGLGVLVIAPDGDRYMYCHLNSRDVAPGSYVSAGGRIGGAGSTGNSTGPHLHVESGDGHVLRCPQPQLLAIYDGRAVPSMASLPTSGCVQ